MLLSGLNHLLTDIHGICIYALRHDTPWFLLGNINYYYLVLFLLMGFIWALSKEKTKIFNVIIVVGVLIIIFIVRALLAG